MTALNIIWVVFIALLIYKLATDVRIRRWFSGLGGGTATGGLPSFLGNIPSPQPKTWWLIALIAFAFLVLEFAIWKVAPFGTGIVGIVGFCFAQAPIGLSIVLAIIAFNLFRFEAPTPKWHRVGGWIAAVPAAILLVIGIWMFVAPSLGVRSTQELFANGLWIGWAIVIIITIPLLFFKTGRMFAKWIVAVAMICTVAHCSDQQVHEQENARVHRAKQPPNESGVLEIVIRSGWTELKWPPEYYGWDYCFEAPRKAELEYINQYTEPSEWDVEKGHTFNLPTVGTKAPTDIDNGKPLWLRAYKTESGATKEVTLRYKFIKPR